MDSPLDSNDAIPPTPSTIHCYMLRRVHVKPAWRACGQMGVNDCNGWQASLPLAEPCRIHVAWRFCHSLETLGNAWFHVA